MADTAQPDLNLLRLQQERELKEKELALRERELQAQRDTRTPWSTPAVVAIVGGLLGYMGTLISSYQNRQLERDKHEATLILEAIKTTGSAAEKEKQTAANLVFLADAGLITSIKPAELAKLRSKAQGAGPSLPAVQGVDFQRSSLLTSDLQAKLQTALAEYQRFLTRIGYDAEGAQGRVTVRIDEEDPTNAYFDNESVVIGRKLAAEPEYALSEYTWQVLKQTNPKVFQILWETPFPQASGFGQGLKLYLTCSHLDDPHIGKNYYALSGQQERQAGRSYLFDLSEFRAFNKKNGTPTEPHELGQIWGGAFWEIRATVGRDEADRIILDSWKKLDGAPSAFGKPSFYVAAIVAAAQRRGTKPIETIRQAFARRGLE